MFSERARVVQYTLDSLIAGADAKFGTSGFRGLATDLTDLRSYVCASAFLLSLRDRGELEHGSRVLLGMDLRPSSPRILNACARAVADVGCIPCSAERMCSPALTFFGMQQKLPTIMVTGSHIPDDRNGIKFTTQRGEITKADEVAIMQQSVSLDTTLFNREGAWGGRQQVVSLRDPVWNAYAQRYKDFFGADSLSGLRIGVYQHSAVARDFLVDLYRQLGAEVIPFARSDRFIPVDTEAIRPEDVELAARWARENRVDVLVSTDGDSDRPLLAGSDGRWLRGDVLGILVARSLGATGVAAPVSCNTALESCDSFSQVTRCKIGSPFVIAAMEELQAGGAEVVVGYEANGGFLLQTPVTNGAGQVLAPLPSRDAVLPHLVVMKAIKERSCSVQDLIAELPKRFTASDRLTNIAPTETKKFLHQLTSPPQQDVTDDHCASATNLLRDSFHSEVVNIDLTDGVRMVLASGEIVHFRGSGNAPELRCYGEASDEGRADEIVRLGLNLARGAVGMA